MPSRFIARLFKRKELQPEDQLQSSDLKRVEDLIQQGKLKKALAEADKIEIREELGENDRLQNQVLKSRILIQQGNSDRGLELADLIFAESQQLENHLVMVDALISKASALLELGRLSESLQVIQEGEDLLSTKRFDKFQNAIRDSALKHLKGKVYRKKGDLDPALEVLKECLAIRQNLGNSYVIAEALNDIGIIYASKGDFPSAIENLEQAMAIFENLGNQPPIIKIRNNIGMIYWQTGKLDLALKFFQESYALSEELGNKRFIAAIATNIGLILWHRGELDSALDHYNKGLEIYETLAYKAEMATCLNNIGIIHSTRGELDLALDCFQRSLALAEEQGNKREIAANHNNIGLVYRDQGNPEGAFPNFERSLQLYEEIGNDFNTCEPLYRLVELAIHETSPEAAQPYFHRLAEMNASGENKLVSQKYRLARALMLKTSGRIVKKGEAQILLQHIADEEIIKHDTTVEAMLNLCELLIAELGVSGNEEILTDIDSLLNDLHDIASDQHIFEWLARTHLLRSKVALLELDIKEARNLLAQAQLIAEETGLINLAMTISSEFDSLLKEQAKWDKYVDQNASMRERLELARLEELVTRMVQKRIEEAPEVLPEEPVMVFILADSGLSLYSHSFPPQKMEDDQLLAGFLAAIRTMGSEIFSESGTMERIMYQEYTIAFKPLESMMFCYVFKGQSYSALRKLDLFMGVIQTSSSIWEALIRTLQTGLVLVGADETGIQKITNETFLSAVDAV
ncbi:MAG: tetratricopeptide repeat protein [Candidatus Thorarchaeota archaeon]